MASKLLNSQLHTHTMRSLSPVSYTGCYPGFFFDLLTGFHCFILFSSIVLFLSYFWAISQTEYPGFITNGKMKPWT